MGQYHKVYNLSKKQYIHARAIDNGLKLLEQIGHLKSTSTALFLLLANSNNTPDGKYRRGGGDAQPHPLIGAWAGDRIVVQGDYAEEGDPAFIPEEELETYTEISAQVLDMFKVALANY